MEILVYFVLGLIMGGLFVGSLMYCFGGGKK
jgi:hypothetical protein